MKKLTKEQKQQQELEMAIEKDSFNEMFDIYEDDTDYYENKFLEE